METLSVFRAAFHITDMGCCTTHVFPLFLKPIVDLTYSEFWKVRICTSVVKLPSSHYGWYLIFNVESMPLQGESSFTTFLLKSGVHLKCEFDLFIQLSGSGVAMATMQIDNSSSSPFLNPCASSTLKHHYSNSTENSASEVERVKNACPLFFHLFTAWNILYCFIYVYRLWAILCQR